MQIIFSIYSGDKECEGELIVDGTVLKTRPIKNRDWISTINVSHKTYTLCDSEASNDSIVKVDESNSTDSIGIDPTLETGTSLCKGGPNIRELKDCSPSINPLNMLKD